MGRRLAAAFGRFALLALLFYALVLGLMLLGSRATVYPFVHDSDVRSPSGLPGIGLASLRSPSGAEVMAWVVPPAPGRPVVVVFTGNAGQMWQGVARAEPLVSAGYGAAILSYPGANGAPGRPDEATITDAALGLVAYLRQRYPQAPPPVLFGMSLGAAVAIRVALTELAGALVLEAPFTSVWDVARVHYPFLPRFSLLRHSRWESLAAAPRVGLPALVLHGGRDRIIPPDQGRRIAEALGGNDTTFHLLPGSGHNDMHLHGADAQVRAFLDRLYPD